MSLNPYGGFLGDRDPLQVIAATPGEVDRLTGALGADKADRPPAPGKWSAREIVCHLADCEVVFAFRLRQTLAEDGPVIQPFDQEKWASRYVSCDLATAVAVLTAVRSWNLILIRNAPEAAFSRKVTHPERGEMTFRTLVETMAGHDLNHLKQLKQFI
jgi:hypothetical protein